MQPVLTLHGRRVAGCYTDLGPLNRHVYGQLFAFCEAVSCLPLVRLSDGIKSTMRSGLTGLILPTGLIT